MVGATNVLEHACWVLRLAVLVIALLAQHELVTHIRRSARQRVGVKDVLEHQELLAFLCDGREGQELDLVVVI